MEREFEKFRGGPTQKNEERLHVTIGKDYVIGLNLKCYNLLGKPLAVYLYFSRASDIIAIEPVANPRLPEAFPVKERGYLGWRINAAPFCKHFGIRLDATERFIRPDIRDGKLLLNLFETVTVCRQNRRKRKQ